MSKETESHPIDKAIKDLKSAVKWLLAAPFFALAALGITASQGWNWLDAHGIRPVMSGELAAFNDAHTAVERDLAETLQKVNESVDRRVAIDRYTLLNMRRIAGSLELSERIEFCQIAFEWRLPKYDCN